MDKLFLVGCGGAVGAILRYMISLVPWKGEFPLLTLITNLAGAILIGLVVGLAFSKDTISPNIVLFLRREYVVDLQHFLLFHWKH